MTAYPALVVVAPGGSKTLPSAAELMELVSNAVEEAGWDGHDLLDVREEEVMLQDEVPPNERVPVPGVVLVYDQTQLLHPDLYRTPVQIAINAIHEEYGRDVELWLDGVVIGTEAQE